MQLATIGVARVLRCKFVASCKVVASSHVVRLGEREANEEMIVS